MSDKNYNFGDIDSLVAEFKAEEQARSDAARIKPGSSLEDFEALFVKPSPSSPMDIEDAEPTEEVLHRFSPLHALMSFLFSLLCAGALLLVLLWVHPGADSPVGSPASGFRLHEKLDLYMYNAAGDALQGLAYIPKIYTIPESDSIAPNPDPDAFIRTTDVNVVLDLIARAEPLLDGQEVIFDPNADFVGDSEFICYLDDTIMVITWKEYINQRCCTCAEVKIAHGSQLRRKIADDTYSASTQYYASEMAKAVNSVVAINGDFYAFRDLGITVYQRQLYRNNPATVDTCYFTASGDMIFSRAGELMGEGEAQRFIEENDVVFAVAFGPILVDGGQLQHCESYPIGEVHSEYSRSCISQKDELHYFLMTINHTMDARPRCNINQLAEYVHSKGVEKAYTLDGGQTAEIIMLGGPINHVDFGYERLVSDIIYFASAIPDEEVSQ